MLKYNLQSIVFYFFNLILFYFFLALQWQELMGVNMRNGMLHYAAYRNVFPIWALAEYRNLILFSNSKIN